MTENIPRQPKGVPVGGQFAATAHAEPEIVLAVPAPESEVHFDADGTDWDWKDPDATILASTSIGGIGIQINTKAEDGAFSYDVIDYGRGRKVGSGTAATLADAKEAGKAERDRAVQYSKRFGIKEGYPTPWGSADNVTHLAPGMASVSTPGHGGIKLSPARNKEVDPTWARGNGFYEEDCEWAITAITFPEGFSEEHQRYAHESARRWFPDEYEAVVGKDPAKYGVTDYKPIAPGESLVRDEKVFFAENSDKVQRAWSASYSKDHPGMTEVTVSDVTSTGARTGTSRVILVPSEEYSSVGNFRTFPRDAPYQVIKEH